MSKIKQEFLEKVFQNGKIWTMNYLYRTNFYYNDNGEEMLAIIRYPKEEIYVSQRINDYKPEYETVAIWNGKEWARV